MQQLESDLDVTQEKLMNANQRLEEKEKALQNAEGEVAALNRRVASLEEDLEKSEERLLTATQKLDLAATAGDDSQRMCKVLENKALSDEARMESLENQLKDARILAEEADKKYDDIAKKLQMVESDLDRAEERADTGETKIIELEEELRVVGNNLKSLEVSEEKANQREEHYRNCKKRLTDWKMNSSTRRRNSRLSQMNLTKPSPRCLAIKLYPNFQDDCSKQKLLFVTPTSLHTISAGLFLISLFSTTLHKLLVTLPANPCLSKLLSEFEKYLPNFKEQVAFFSPNKKCSSLIKPPNFVSQKSLQSQYLQR